MANRIETSLLVKGLTADTYALDVRGKTFVGGDIEINGNVNIVGTATTINTQTVQARDNKIELNYSGSTSSAIGGGIEILSGRTDGSSVSLTIDTDRDWNSNTGFNITGRTSDSTTNGLKVVNSLGTDNLVVRNDGNVGIGTLTPTTKLEISGDTKLSSLSNVFKISSYTALGMSQGVGATNVFIGGGVVTDGTNGGGISIGPSSTSFGEGISIGQTAKADSSGGDAIAIGRSSTANGSVRSVAIGRNATSSASNAWALGYNATASQDNTFIFGNSSDVNIKSGFGTNTPEARIHIKGSDSSSSNYGLKVQNSGGTDNLLVRNDGLITVNDVTNGSDSSNSVRFFQTIPATGTYNYGFYSVGAPTYANYAAVGNTSRTHFYSSESPKTAYEADMAATVSSPYRVGFNASVIGINTGGTNVALYSDVRNGVSNYTIYSVNGDSFFNKTSMTLNGKTTGSDSVFSVNNSGGTNNFVVRNDGNIGIGTSTPDSKLVIKGIDSTTSNYGLKVQNSGGGNLLYIRNDGKVDFWSNGDFDVGLSLYNTYNFDNILRVKTNTNVVALNIDDNGNSGFGQASSNSRVYIQGVDATASNFALKVENSGSTALLYVRNDGNVGIGTSTPTEKLEVNGKTKTATLQVTSGATSGYVLTATDTNGNMSWQSSIKKYSTTLTSPTTGNYTITHNLDTADISVTLWLVTTDEMTNANINTRTTNSVTVSFLSDVGEDVRVVVIG